MKIIKGFNKFIKENSDLRIVKTVDEVIKFYTDPKPNLFGTGTMGQDRWDMAKNSFYDMANGGVGDISGEEGENNIRDEIYNGWEDIDFQKVIDAVEGSSDKEGSVDSTELSETEKQSIIDEIKNIKDDEDLDISFGETKPLGNASSTEIRVGNEIFDIIKDIIDDEVTYKVFPNSPKIKRKLNLEDIEEVAYYISLWV
jgi:hypothetical protein